MNVIEIIDTEIADLETAKRVLLRLAGGSVAAEIPKSLPAAGNQSPKALPPVRASLDERVEAYLRRNGPKTLTEMARGLGEDGRTIFQAARRVATKRPDSTWEANDA